MKCPVGEVSLRRNKMTSRQCVQLPQLQLLSTLTDLPLQNITYITIPEHQYALKIVMTYLNSTKYKHSTTFYMYLPGSSACFL